MDSRDLDALYSSLSKDQEAYLGSVSPDVLQSYNTEDVTSITVTPGSANWVYILGTSYTTGTPTVGSSVQADTTVNWRVVVRAWA